MLFRYHRQELIENWDQEKLRKAKIAIIGDGKLAEYTALPLTALGVGEIRLIGNSKSDESFLDFKPCDGYKVEYLQKCLTEINPDVDIIGIKGDLESSSMAYFLEDVDIVIDTTNSPKSKANVLQNKNKVITASTKENFGRVSCAIDNDFDYMRLNKHIMPEFELCPEDPFASMVIGGIVTDEVKKYFMGETVEDDVMYSSSSRQRFDWKGLDFSDADYSDKKVLVVGAGALGNFVAMGLSEMGVGNVDVMDNDIIEDTNLNRQVLYYDSVGGEKSKILSEKMKKMNNKMKVSNINKFFDDEFNGSYDVILDCVDNFDARYKMSKFSFDKKIPMVSGGTDYKSGQVAVYVPEKTPCMDCQMGFGDLAEKTKGETAGCLEEPNPSVIFTNQIIGGMMIDEARHILSGKKELDGRADYNSNAIGRGSVTKKKVRCNHD